WCEAATCAAVSDSLEPGQTRVGTRVSLEHLGASAVGERLSVQASIGYVDGRLVRLVVSASHSSDGKVVGTGEVTRVVVDRERFLARLSGPAG
ncbi:MAG: thioesterase family protein, partial [Nocardioidaceae bacterium]